MHVHRVHDRSIAFRMYLYFVINIGITLPRAFWWRACRVRCCVLSVTFATYHVANITLGSQRRIEFIVKNVYHDFMDIMF